MFQIIEQGAELERMSTQKALLIMERRTFLERLVNTSRSHPLNKEVSQSVKSVQKFLKYFQSQLELF